MATAESEQTGKQTGAKKRPAPSTAFKPGQSGNPSGKAHVARERPDGLTEAGRMRLVYGQPKRDDCNSAQRVLRGFLEKQPGSYIKLLTDLERAESAGGAGDSRTSTPSSVPPAVPTPDEGEARVRALIAELLDETEANL
jgi:hypothetical protein